MKIWTLRILLFTLMAAIPLNQAKARDMRGRLGIGMSNQYVHNMPALSFKLQKNRSLAIGALLALQLDDSNGGHGAGIKIYRIIFDEPQLSFYSSGLIGYLADKQPAKENSGFQVDLTLGSEFGFVGLESIGFSFEFGLSFNNVYEDTAFGTAGYHLVTAGVHFYL